MWYKKVSGVIEVTRFLLGLAKYQDLSLSELLKKLYLKPCGETYGS